MFFNGSNLFPLAHFLELGQQRHNLINKGLVLVTLQDLKYLLYGFISTKKRKTGGSRK